MTPSHSLLAAAFSRWLLLLPVASRHPRPHRCASTRARFGRALGLFAGPLLTAAHRGWWKRGSRLSSETLRRARRETLAEISTRSGSLLEEAACHASHCACSLADLTQVGCTAGCLQLVDRPVFDRHRRRYTASSRSPKEPCHSSTSDRTSDRTTARSAWPTARSRCTRIQLHCAAGRMTAQPGGRIGIPLWLHSGRPRQRLLIRRAVRSSRVSSRSVRRAPQPPQPRRAPRPARDGEHRVGVEEGDNINPADVELLAIGCATVTVLARMLRLRV